MGRLGRSAVVALSLVMGFTARISTAQDYQSNATTGSTGVTLGTPIFPDRGGRGYGNSNQIYRENSDRDWDGLSNRYSDGQSGGYDYSRKPNDELPCPPGHDDLPLPTARASIWGHDRNKPFTVDYIFLPRSDVDDPSTDMMMHEIGLTYMFRIPFGDRWLFTFRPFFDIMFLSGPGGAAGPQVPEQLYKVAVDIQADFKINEVFGVMIGLTPGFWTDFNSVSGDDFRLPVRILGTARLNEQLYVAAGLLYTDNIRRNLLPTGGVIWDFADKWRLELMYPRSRIVYKFHEELQFYGVVERAGDTWNIRENGINEDFEYRDVRISIGAQVDVWERASFFVETGVAIARKLRFDVQPERDVSSSFVLRTGVKF